MRQTTVYNSFTGIGPGERNKLINFICQNCSQAPKSDVIEALEYALKQRPSFGGFVIAVKEKQEYLASILVNNTGMKGYNASNIFVYVAVNQKHPDRENILEEIMCKALDMSNGDVALRLDPKSPVIKFCKKLGFTQQTVELQHNRSAVRRFSA